MIISETKGLCFSWDSGAAGWFQGLDLTLEAGHIYGLMGRNGAGKTTLIKLLTGCLKPQSGNVHLLAGANGERLDVVPRSRAVLQEQIFVPEAVELPPLTTVNWGRLAGALYPRFSLLRFQEHLRAFEVPENALLPRLSFGQRRKAHIAFALATDARLIFLDEPTNGLDIAAQIVLRQLLVANLSPERSFVVSTHHLREFETVIDQILVVEHGRIIARSDVETLQSAPGYRDLESWYAQLIGIALPQLASGGVQHADV